MRDPLAYEHLLGRFERANQVIELEGHDDRLAGPDWFSIGANMRWVIDRELTFSAPTTEDPLLRWEPDAQAAMFARLAESEDEFHHWHTEAVMDTARWQDPKMWHAKDHQVRAAYANEPSFATTALAEEWLDGANRERSRAPLRQLDAGAAGPR